MQLINKWKPTSSIIVTRVFRLAQCDGNRNGSYK